MVSVIKTTTDVRGPLNYNEKKVAAGKAILLTAPGFLMEAAEMHTQNKLQRFLQRTSLNKRTLVNTIHVSLNFHWSEKITDTQMTDMAETYMAKIGFAGQPFLVYRHYDAGHPHCHIVSVNIKRDGSAISMHNIGRRFSMPAIREIETLFSLVKAGEASTGQNIAAGRTEVEKAVYGKSSTKKMITNIVQHVIQNYACTSVQQFNSVLRQYNVLAAEVKSRQLLGSRYGLVYVITDDRGNRVSTPIYASRIAGKPTIRQLKKIFERNNLAAAHSRARMQAIISWELAKQPANLRALDRGLAHHHIAMIYACDRDGMVHGISFICNKSGAVMEINNTDRHSHLANALIKSGLLAALMPGGNMEIKEPAQSQTTVANRTLNAIEEQFSSRHRPLRWLLAEQLLAPVQSDTEPAAIQFQKKKRKKRKRKTIY